MKQFYYSLLRLFLTIIIMLGLSSCVFYNSLPSSYSPEKNETVEEVTSTTLKPKIYIDFDDFEKTIRSKYQNEDDKRKENVEKLLKKYKTSLETNLKNLLSNHFNVVEMKKGSKFWIKIQFNFTASSENGSTMSFCLLSLGIFPGWLSNQVEIGAKLYNSTLSNEISQFNSTGKTTMICHLVLFPFGLYQYFSQGIAIDSLMLELSEDLATKIINYITNK